MASDLIYREDAKVFVRHACYKKINPIDYLDEVPAADVRPVVRGEWWPAKDGYYGHVMCSACHKIESHETGFCPNCGCQMNGGRK